MRSEVAPILTGRWIEWRVLRGVRNRLVRLGLSVMTLPMRRLNVEVEDLGSPKSSWWLPVETLQETGVAVLAGIGLDASLDLELSARGWRVISVDPTPRSLQYAEDVGLAVRGIQVVPVALGGVPRVAHFYPPANAAEISHSLLNLQQTDRPAFTAPVVTLRDICAEVGVVAPPTILKLDIEGAEHETLERILSDGDFPEVILVEWDQPVGLRVVAGSLARLRAAGYGLVKVSHFNHTFMRESRVAP